MAKNYDEQKIYAELSKLNTDEQFNALQRISGFVSKNLEAEGGELQERQAEISEKLKKINGN